MDSLERRNLNRLRNGKMMLEFEKRISSPVFAFVFALFLVTEIVLAPYYVTRANTRLQSQQELKHGVLRV